MERSILNEIVWTTDEHTRFYYKTIHVPEDCLELHQVIEWNGIEWIQSGDSYPDGWSSISANDDCLRFVLQKYGIPETILPLRVIRTHCPKRLRSLSEAISVIGIDRFQRFFHALKAQSVIPISYLGGGGWGFVFHVRNGRQNFALKVLRPPYEQEWIRRFRREASTLQSISSKVPGAIVPGLEEIDSLLCIRMRLIKGRPLSDISLPTTPLVASKLISDILQRLTPVHKAGIVHRDLHLGNVMVSTSGFITLVDFGLAHEHYVPGISETFRPVGTMSHCAPEKWLRPSHAGPRSDVFSIGVMLYKLLTGNHPFWAETYIELYELIKDGRFEPASCMNPNVPPMFDIAINEMLASNPASRPGDAAEAQSIIRNILVLEKIRTRRQQRLPTSVEGPDGSDVQLRRLSQD